MCNTTDTTQLLTFKEVSAHNKKSDCWLIISNKVYDVTPYLDDHPGGDEMLLKATGKDATLDFEEMNHSEEATSILKQYYVGDLDCSTLPEKKKNLLEGIQTSNRKSLEIFQILAPLLALALTYSFYLIY